MPEEDTQEEAALPTTVFRPICTKPQLLLVKNVESSLVSFPVVLVFSVFRGALTKDASAGRKMKVSKNLGINAPAEAVSRLMVLFLDWIPPSKVLRIVLDCEIL